MVTQTKPRRKVSQDQIDNMFQGLWDQYQLKNPDLLVTKKDLYAVVCSDGQQEAGLQDVDYKLYTSLEKANSVAVEKANTIGGEWMVAKIISKTVVTRKVEVVPIA